MTIKCPHCSAEVEYVEKDSEICSECGGELKPEESSVKKCKDVFADLDFAAIFGTNTSSKKSECPHLKVEYNHNLAFLTDCESLIKLKLTPLDDRLQSLLVFMEAERNGDPVRRQIHVKEILQKNKTFFLKVPFNPEETSGRLCLNFYIGCKVDGVFTYYQFSADHRVYDSTQSGTLFNQITINQEFTSNQAADINYRDSIGDALKKVAEKNLSINEMIDRLNDSQEYKVEYLMKTTWRPEDILIKGYLYPATELMLEYEGKTLFLLNKPSVKLGRDPKLADLLVRCGQGSLGPQEYPNATVSKIHAEIVYCNDTVKLFDRSTHGTYINDRKPDTAGIPLDSDEALVEFGDIHWMMNIQKCNVRLPHSICQTCTASKIKSVTFTRKDSEPEYYLLIWQCCELGRIIEELTDWTIFARNGCFFIRTPDQHFYHLRPGQKISSKTTPKEIEVKYFEQKRR